MAEWEPTDLGQRVAYLVSAYPGTSHTFISREVAALRELGLHVDTFSIKPATKAELEDEALRQQATETFTVRLQSPITFLIAQFSTFFARPISYFSTLARAIRHRPPGMRAFCMSFLYFAEAVVLARELKRRRITRIHNHFANAGAITGYLAAGLLGLPWSFTMHGISETDYPAGLLLGKKIEAADFVACVSYYGRAQAMRTVSPEQWSKLHVVRCGLSLADLPAHSGSGNRRRIISVGRLSPEKGQAGLLDAFASILTHSPEVDLVLVGDGPQASELQATADALGISENVTFLGRLGECATLDQIAASDILVVSSFMEGLPVVLMEAMAVGTAVISSRVAGIPELVQDGMSGLLFTPSKWDELAASIRRLLADQKVRRTLAQHGQIAVRDGFDIRTSASQLLSLFNRVRS